MEMVSVITIVIYYQELESTVIRIHLYWKKMQSFLSQEIIGEAIHSLIQRTLIQLALYFILHLVWRFQNGKIQLLLKSFYFT